MYKGIKLLIKRCREQFREENEDFYSKEDLKKAERKYVIFCLKGDFNNLQLS